MDEISYEEFGANFVANIVTPERVGATIERLAGEELAVGPMQAGPGGAASVMATGRIGPIRPQVVLTRERLSFDAVIPIELNLDVRVAGVSHRYTGSVDVALRLDVRAVAPVMLIIDVNTVTADDVKVRLEAEQLRARFLQRIGDVDEEVRRAVAEMVNERLASPEAQEVRVYDILSYVESAFDS
ncbi:MAG: hypothetical protein WAT66_07775 [Actinomycetota bacterium]